MQKYNPQEIENKWQKIWKKSGIYKTKDLAEKPKFYALDMFPYPSGEGLHVGHTKGYTATDAVSRMKMMQGFNILHPMGWDAFGLPAENYAIKNKIHPRISTEKNIAVFKKQLEKIGFIYDWDREINTTDPEFYKWTQWIFLKMFEKGLAYESDEPVNWCPSCKTVLANEDLENGACERCSTQVVQKKMKQWVLKMTVYADRLLYDLDKKDLEWEELIKEQQRNWIGRSEGAVVKFKVQISKFKVEVQSLKLENNYIEVFTTRLDTIFGCAYCVVAPEHLLVENYKLQITNYKEVEKYIIQARNKTEMERTALAKEKTGVELKGIKAINPFTNEEVSVWVADYVLGSYGTGAVMAVPAHDERDFEFAKKYDLPIKKSIIPPALSEMPQSVNDVLASSGGHLDNSIRIKINCFTEDGELINSGKYTGLISRKAREEMIKWLEEKKIGKRKVNYKMRDWVFSRQRYWGEPFPLVFCPACKKQAESLKFKVKSEKLAENFKNTTNYKLQTTNYSLGEILNPGWIAVSGKDLPVRLPDVESYEPTGTGESPLANIKEWVNVKCPKCGGAAKRETNTMPQWAGSSWYYLRYIDPKNKKVLVDKDKEKSWMPVDLYVGGAEHATRHLLYARFWHKFLYDIGVVSVREPFKKLYHVGLILAPDGRKMSKRWGNVINPDDVIREFGADSFRLYEMFMGPFSQAVSWNTKGAVGMRRFLERIWQLNVKCQMSNVNSNPNDKIQNSNKLERLVHQTIKKVTEDIEEFKFNTAISALMILANEFERQEKTPKDYYEKFLIILAPFAPHIAEELWSFFAKAADDKSPENKNKYQESIFEQSWPKYDPRLVSEEEIELVIQINGKVKDRIKAAADISEDEAKKLALESEKIKKAIDGKGVKKVIFVKGRLINLVIKFIKFIK
ncbi:leucine--tRNA ligase [Patescibacteria group bacterium]|nr:leucine--tRNA ligase [Patescibacteria group bacterium]